jgi:hypothetical protein
MKKILFLMAINKEFLMHTTRIISLLLSLLLVPQFAFASHANELKEAVDEYFFSMTVEWDQKDLSFANEQQAIFSNKVNTLIKNGLTIDELKGSLSETTGLDYLQLEPELNLIDTNNIRVLANFIKEKMASKYSTGASWDSGEIIPFAILGLLGVFLVRGIFLMVKCKNGPTPLLCL